ncbi:rSAM-modified peptide [Flavobacterium sp. FlaQc-52]
MKTKKIKFEDFKADKLSKKQQKAVRGGDDPIDVKDPIKGGGNTGGNG